MLARFVEPTHFNHFQFENQQRTFHNYRFAVDPTAGKPVQTSAEQFIGKTEKISDLEAATVFERKVVRTTKKRKREDKGDLGDIDGYQGPWAGYEGQEKVSKPTDEQKAVLEAQFSKMMYKKKPVQETVEGSSMLHIDDPKDYLGRPFLHISQDFDVDLRSNKPPEKCYVPKK